MSASSPVPHDVSGTNPNLAAKGAAVIFAGTHALVVIFGVHVTMRPMLRFSKTFYKS